jgi:hypothetical protein
MEFTFDFVEKIEVRLKRDNNNGDFTRMLMFIYNTMSLNSKSTHILSQFLPFPQKLGR